MAYYDELNSIMNDVISAKILRNQRICKALYYYPDDVNLAYDPFAQPDIPDTSILLMDKIFPLPKIPDVEPNNKAYLNIVLTGGEKTEGNGYRNINLIFEIIIHLDVWCIKNGLRPYVIASEIDKMFNNQQTSLPIENKPEDLGFAQKDYSNKYYGLQLAYRLSVKSNVGCTPTYVTESIPPTTIPSFMPKNLGVR